MYFPCTCLDCALWRESIESISRRAQALRTRLEDIHAGKHERMMDGNVYGYRALCEEEDDLEEQLQNMTQEVLSLGRSLEAHRSPAPAKP